VNPRYCGQYALSAALMTNSACQAEICNEPMTGPSAENLAHRASDTREREVLTLIARGLTNSEIAEALGISATTVKSHIGRIFVKLDLRDRPAVIVYAYEHGIVTADHRNKQI
jgi:DNA-binding NarL/FixJ family response regulator